MWVWEVGSSDGRVAFGLRGRGPVTGRTPHSSPHTPVGRMVERLSNSGKANSFIDH